MKTQYIAVYAGDVSANGQCGRQTKEIMNAVLDRVFKTEHNTQFVVLFAAQDRQLMFEYCRWRLIAAGYEPYRGTHPEDVIREGFWNKKHRVVLHYCDDHGTGTIAQTAAFAEMLRYYQTRKVVIAGMFHYVVRIKLLWWFLTGFKPVDAIAYWIPRRKATVRLF